MRNRGFTLIELMIVVAIIAIITAVAIPSILNARKSGNEARAISTLRSIVTVQEQYRTRFGNYANPFQELEAAGYIDIEFDAYDIVAYAALQNAWAMSIRPRTAQDADRYFFTDNSGVIRFSSTGPATVASEPID
ncbi:MAG: prepilin-type N-terminal cleavage/methylation domain-containing protein [Planctomycetota bacterium]